MNPDTEIKLFERTGRIEAMVENLTHQLLGNGQPGAITNLGKADEALSKRLTALEDGRAMIKGILWFIGILISGVGTVEVLVRLHVLN